jgi:hypothetical protein
LRDQLEHAEQRGKLVYQDGEHRLYPLGGGCLQVVEAELNESALPHIDVLLTTAAKN